MSNYPKNNAIVYCEGAFNTPNGKTAHGLVRRTSRYHVLSVIDSRYSDQDAGFILDEQPNNIPIYVDLEKAFKATKIKATHLVVGLAPDGGRLDANARNDIKKALEIGLNVDSGLHDFLSEDPELSTLAKIQHVKIRDIRKPPPRNQLHFFSGKIEQVKSLKIAVLGTDSAIGKRTTAWIILDALRNTGHSAELIGTGQTAWMQGAKYSIVLDSIVNDFVSGEIEHAVWSAWNDNHPDVIIIEGQGSLMNPAYPGGFEILAAGRPDIVILQHAPARKDYDGFPGYPIHSLEKQIQAIELISGKPVVAITINHENMDKNTISHNCILIEERIGVRTSDVLIEGADIIVSVIEKYLNTDRS